MAQPLINGRAYDYSQIVATILGAPIFGISAITYTEEQEKTNNFGQGNRPVSRGHAAINASASIELSMNEVEALRDLVASERGSLLAIPAFDITVTYLNNQKVVTHILKNCEFTNDGVETTQGDTDIKRSFDLVVSHIDYRD